MTTGRKRFRLVTADGRDVTDKEWRKIPEFPDYEINDDSDVRRKSPTRGWYLLTAQECNRTWTYSLYSRDGSKTTRNYWKLTLSAFPELDQGWKTIPGHDNYEINIKGQVRGKRRRQIIMPTESGTVVLRRDGHRVHWHIHDLYEFPNFWDDLLPKAQRKVA